MIYLMLDGAPDLEGPEFTEPLPHGVSQGSTTFFCAKLSKKGSVSVSAKEFPKYGGTEEDQRATCVLSKLIGTYYVRPCKSCGWISNGVF